MQTTTCIRVEHSVSHYGPYEHDGGEFGSMFNHHRDWGSSLYIRELPIPRLKLKKLHKMGWKYAFTEETFIQHIQGISNSQTLHRAISSGFVVVKVIPKKYLVFNDGQVLFEPTTSKFEVVKEPF